MKEILERLTLRKIVALGLAATEDQPVAAEPSEFTPTVAFPGTLSAGEDPRISAAAERRKARLRSLLDTF